MKLKFLLGVAVATLMVFTACEDTTDGIGISLTDNVDHLEVSTNTFYATTRSVGINSVVSRNTMGYLGCIKDPETGALITGDFMTQFNCLENYKVTLLDSIASLDADGKVIADSCEVRLFYTNYYGDSLATMKLTLYELDHPMTEEIQYYSDFSPLDEGYVREDGICKTQAYSLYNATESKEKSSTSKEYVNNICVRLNEPYTDRKGNHYNNFGTYILRNYFEHPEFFKNSNVFTRNLLPGFFFKMSGGLGSMAYVSIPQLNIFYRMHIKNKSGNDSIVSRFTLFNGTEEILQTTTITNDAVAISDLVNDNSCTYIKSPSGIFTEVTLPVDEIVRGHENDTINTAKIAFNRINNEQWNKYNLPAPKTLLMLETDSVTSFFEKGKLANYKQSFISNYSSSSNKYVFNNIGGLINAMYAAKTSGLKSDPDWVSKHPNWNKVMLVPVTTTSTTTSTSSTILTGGSHDMSLSSTRLIGGTTPIIINVIYSRFD
ncbi:MAG: DUF4270 domain-containing protein [Prevotella sp.]|nr:DUF4270 domain-containing protein [Prevotella sp.]